MSNSQPGDFAADVVDILRRRRVTFHGCAADYLEVRLDGSLKMWFKGHRNGQPWAGGLTLINPDISKAVYFGDSNVIAELCERLIDDNHVRFDLDASVKPVYNPIPRH